MEEIQLLQGAPHWEAISHAWQVSAACRQVRPEMSCSSRNTNVNCICACIALLAEQLDNSPFTSHQLKQKNSQMLSLHKAEPGVGQIYSACCAMRLALGYDAALPLVWYPVLWAALHGCAIKAWESLRASITA